MPDDVDLTPRAEAVHTGIPLYDAVLGATAPAEGTRLPDYLEQQASRPWQEVSGNVQAHFGVQPTEEIHAFHEQRSRRRTQDIAIERARQEEEPNPEGFEHTLYRRMPLIRTGMAVVDDMKYNQARARFQNYQASPEDMQTIARYEHLQKLTGQENFGEKLLALPAMAAEMLMGGRAVGAAAPLLSQGAGTGAAVARGIGSVGVMTAAMPEMWAPQWSRNNLEAGRDTFDPRGLGQPLLSAYIQGAILHSIGAAGGEGGLAGLVERRIGLGGTGAAQLAGQTATRGALGSLEQEAADAATHALGLNAGYGPLTDLALGRGETDENLQRAAMNALTFAVAANLHNANTEKTLRDVAGTLRRLHERGVAPEQAGQGVAQSLQTLQDRVQQAHQGPQDLTRAEALETAQRAPEGPYRTMLEAIAQHFPEVQVPRIIHSPEFTAEEAARARPPEGPQPRSEGLAGQGPAEPAPEQRWRNTGTAFDEGLNFQGRDGRNYRISGKDREGSHGEPIHSVYAHEVGPNGELGDNVGSVHFGQNENGTSSAEELIVHPDHRKNGVGEAMYDAFQNHYGAIEPHTVQKPEGKRFWERNQEHAQAEDVVQRHLEQIHRVAPDVALALYDTLRVNPHRMGEFAKALESPEFRKEVIRAATDSATSRGWSPASIRRALGERLPESPQAGEAPAPSPRGAGGEPSEAPQGPAAPAGEPPQRRAGGSPADAVGSPARRHELTREGLVATAQEAIAAGNVVDLADFKKLSGADLRAALQDLGIAGRPASKADALRKIAQVMQSQAEMRAKVQEIQQRVPPGVLEIARDVWRGGDRTHYNDLESVLPEKDWQDVKKVLGTFKENPEAANTGKGLRGTQAQDRAKLDREALSAHLERLYHEFQEAKTAREHGPEAASALGAGIQAGVQHAEGEAHEGMAEQRAGDVGSFPALPSGTTPPAGTPGPQSTGNPGGGPVAPQSFLGVVKGMFRRFGAGQARSNDIMARELNHGFRLLDRDIAREPDAAQRLDKFLDFTDFVEGTRAGPLPGEWTRAATILRDQVKGWEGELQRLDLLKDFNDNYLAHYWGDPKNPNATPDQILASINARRSLAGKESYRKQRTFDTFREGIEAGLEPKSWNPVEMHLWKGHEVNKSIFGRSIFQEMKDKSIAVFQALKAKAPAGWQPISDKLFKVFAPPEMKQTEWFDKQQMEGLEKFAQDIGIDLKRVTSGLGIPGAAGVAQGNTVTTRFGTPEEVLAHEIGHVLDNRFGLAQSMANNQVFGPELAQLADLRASGQPSPSYKAYIQSPPERIANLVAGYLHAPELTKQVAPESYKYLDSFLQSHAQLAPLRDIKPSLELGTREQVQRLAGPMLVGNYYVPGDVAEMANRYLAPGLGDFAAYRALRGATNTLNQFNLGFSGWHATGTALNAAFSDIALGLKMISRGDVGLGLKTLGRGIVFPWSVYRATSEGLKGVREWYAPGSQGGDVAQVLQHMVEGGARAGLDKFYDTGHLEAFRKVYEDFRSGQTMAGLKGSWFGARVLPAIAELVNKPVMEHWVPMLKFSTAMEAIRYEADSMARRGITATPDVMRERFGKIWDSVDNRLGQLVYDNLFWNRTFKDASMAAVRAVGWNVGTWREIGGAVKDVPESFRGIRSGEGISDRVAYTAALSFGTALMGSVAQYLMTGKHPEDLKDLIYPRTGDRNRDGSERRLAFPTYMHHDVAPLFNRADEGPLRWASNIWQSAGNKLSPALTQMHEMFSNQDYFGAAIRNPNDSWTRQARDSFAHLLQGMLPYSLETLGRVRKAGGGVGEQVAAGFGVGPAPSTVTHTAEQQRAMESRRRYVPSPLERLRQQQPGFRPVRGR